MKKNLLGIAAVTAFGVGTLEAGVIYSEDYTGFNGDGTTLSDHAFTGFGTASDLSRGESAGGVSTGGVYDFDTGGGNETLGIQPGGSDWTPGTIAITFTSTEAFTSLDISFDVFVFNDASRANSFALESVTIDSVVFASGEGLTSLEAEDTSPAWVLNEFDTSITATGSVGSEIVLTFAGDDVSGGGSRDEFALDNVVVDAIPEPASLALIGLGGLAMLGRGRRQA